MDHLYAPWRNEYAVGHDKMDKKKLFQKIGMSSNDEENHVIHRAKSCFAVLNRFPYNLGHTMVIPYREVGDFAAMGQEEYAELWDEVRFISQLLQRVLHPHGLNIGVNIGSAGGAGIPDHLHVHIVPRWSGDTNFMTSVNETRIHPGDLPLVYKKLKEALQT